MPTTDEKEHEHDGGTPDGDEADRRETEDLLAGFDRPGRGPRRAGAADFVDHFSKRKDGSSRKDKAPLASPPSEAKGARAADPRRDEVTVLVPREPRRRPALAAALAGLVLVAGAGTAWWATRQGPPDRPAHLGAASAVTTITASEGVATVRADDIPPPEPAATPPPATAEPEASVNGVDAEMGQAAPKASSTSASPSPRAHVPSASANPSPKDAAGSTTTGSTAPAPSAKPPPRDDFLRDL